MAYYSIAEQHKDGHWWYHPQLTYNSKEEAENGFKKAFWCDLDRPYKILEHNKPFPKKEDACSWYSMDLKHWFACYDNTPFELE